MNPYAAFLSPGDNAWQMTAATLVGLMSIPALAVLYGGIVQKKWAVNTMMMVFSAFAMTLIVGVLWAFKMGFGSPWISTFLGKPGHGKQDVSPTKEGISESLRSVAELG